MSSLRLITYSFEEMAISLTNEKAQNPKFLEKIKVKVKAIRKENRKRMAWIEEAACALDNKVRIFGMKAT